MGGKTEFKITLNHISILKLLVKKTNKIEKPMIRMIHTVENLDVPQ